MMFSLEVIGIFPGLQNSGHCILRCHRPLGFSQLLLFSILLPSSQQFYIFGFNHGRFLRMELVECLRKCVRHCSPRETVTIKNDNSTLLRFAKDLLFLPVSWRSIGVPAGVVNLASINYGHGERCNLFKFDAAAVRTRELTREHGYNLGLNDDHLDVLAVIRYARRHYSNFQGFCFAACHRNAKRTVYNRTSVPRHSTECQATAH